MKIGELKYLLTMDPKQWFGVFRKVKSDEEKFRNGAEKPVRLSANVKGLIGGFAAAGLALDGFRRISSLVTGPLREIKQLSDEQEKADQRLASALKSRNLYTEENYQLLKDQASAIQQTTIYGDENNQMLQSLALNMGVAFEKVDEVTKGSIGLAAAFEKAGLSQETALKGIANAMNGNFESLVRYIPELRTLETETEKAAFLQEQMAKGFQIANDEAQTGAGKVKQYENVVGDLKEQLGDLQKQVLVPLAEIGTPVVSFFTGLDAGTRNAGIALVGFLAIAVKVPAVFTAIRAAAAGLTTTLGPAGLLIVGISAAATALSVYAASADDSITATTQLDTANRSLAKSFEQIRIAVSRLGESEQISELIKLQEFYQRRTESSRETLESLYELQSQGSKDVSESQIFEAERTFQKNKETLTALTEEIEKRKQVQSQVTKQLSEEELKELDRLREYQFQTNRISLAEYISYLESRQDATREKFGEESAEYLRFIDRITELRERLSDVGQLLPTEQLDIRIDADSSALDEAIDKFRELYELQLEFSDLGIQDLQVEFNARKEYAERNVETMREVYGQESAEYRQAVFERQVLERSFLESKKQLAIEGFQATVDLGQQLVNVFQGQSKTLFSIGKGLSVAQATINAYEAASRAYKDYPYPFNIAVAAINLALGLGQVQQISKTNFQPQGFAKGSDGPLKNSDILQTAITPPGEDGIIAVQKGEMVINRQSVIRYLPVLRAINQGRLRRGDIPGYQTGGVVGGLPSTPLPQAGVSKEDLENLASEIARSVERVKIEFHSQINALQFYRDTFPEYEQDEKARRV